MKIDPDEINRLIQQVKNCSVCGGDEWSYSIKPFALTELNPDHPTWESARIPMIALICVKCHNMVLFCVNRKSLRNRRD